MKAMQANRNLAWSTTVPSSMLLGASTENVWFKHVSRGSDFPALIEDAPGINSTILLNQIIWQKKLELYIRMARILQFDVLGGLQVCLVESWLSHNHVLGAESVHHESNNLSCCMVSSAQTCHIDVCQPHGSFGLSAPQCE